uniref:DUF1279 domain-containing protein n=1 Tax=Rhabditophanes sp. KR3021 TaxID=114890 RepID=A0AC35UBT5_9BILA
MRLCLSISRLNTISCSNFVSLPSLNYETKGIVTSSFAQQHRNIHFSPVISKFRLSMDEEQKKHKLSKIELQNAEEAPKTLVQKLKFYIKRYWYIAIPVHAVVCSFYFAIFYFLVKSGVDVIAIMKTLHLPESIIEKAQHASPSASTFVLAFLLYKIATPLRYATTVGGIQGTFWTMKKLGKLKTAREVEYKVRNDYERNKNIYGLRNKFLNKKIHTKNFKKEL